MGGGAVVAGRVVGVLAGVVDGGLVEVWGRLVEVLGGLVEVWGGLELLPGLPDVVGGAADVVGGADDVLAGALPARWPGAPQQPHHLEMRLGCKAPLLKYGCAPAMIFLLLRLRN